MILDHGVPPDAVNRHKQVRDAIDAFSFFLLPLRNSQDLFFLPTSIKSRRTKISPLPPCSFFCSIQTPLMLAAMHGKIDCARKLLEAGANVRNPSFFRTSASE